MLCFTYCSKGLLLGFFCPLIIAKVELIETMKRMDAPPSQLEFGVDHLRQIGCDSSKLHPPISPPMSWPLIAATLYAYPDSRILPSLNRNPAFLRWTEFSG